MHTERELVKCDRTARTPCVAQAEKGIRWPRAIVSLGMILVGAFGVSCTTPPAQQVLVSVKDQKVALMNEGKPVKVYPCSTSKFGLGGHVNSFTTPVGRLQVAAKIGDGARPGTVFKGRRPTGEVLKPNAPGRDPIVSRILWLRGLEPQNRDAYSRCIYIHGTPEEWSIGYPASYGCVRMKSKDVIDLYKAVGVGTEVRVVTSGLSTEARRLADAEKASRAASVAMPTASPTNAAGTSNPSVVANARGFYGPEMPR